MTKHLIAAAGAVTVLLTAGCHYTRIATPQLSPEEQRWEDLIRESYPNYTPPPKTTRSFNGRLENRTSAIAENDFKPMDDPTPAEEVKQDVPEEIPADTEKETTAVTENTPAENPAENDVVKEEKTPVDNKNTVEEKAVETKDEAAPANGVTPPDPTNSIVYEVKSGDSLGSIARQMYGDARFSNIIFKANADILKDPNMLRPGMKLIVPKL